MKNNSLYSEDINFNFTSSEKIPGVVYLFPGQGSMGPGMFKEYFSGQDKTFSHYLEKTEKFCKEKKIPSILEYIFGQKLSENNFFLLQNLSIFCCEVSLFEKNKNLLKPNIMFGHSFGEYASLVCSGF